MTAAALEGAAGTRVVTDALRSALMAGDLSPRQRLVEATWGQALSSVYTQAWRAKYLQHDPTADDVLLAESFRYLEPDATGTWRPVALDRAEHLSFYFCSGYDLPTAAGRAADDDLADVGC